MAEIAFMYWVALAAFVLLDALVVALVVRRALRQARRRRGRVGLRAVRRFSRISQEETAAYLRANYSGDVESLPQVMQGVVDALERRARTEGFELSREALKQYAATSAAAYNVASARDVREAIRSVA